MKKLLLLLVFSSTFLGSIAQTPDVYKKLHGIWESEAKDSTTLGLFTRIYYFWNGSIGQYMYEGNEVWMKEGKTGTKWFYRFDGDNLILEKPEDFVYLGKGEYQYLQFSNPKLVLTFHKPKEQKMVTSTHENGNAKTEVILTAFEKGLQKQYYESGKLEVTIELVGGRPHGLYTAYYENGQKEAEYNYTKGVRHGIATFWDDSGKQTKTEEYVEGDLKK
jgi:antitoxin component YwqK of YwqJK toxin-antitoxin module